jgi:hypothetical protein
MFCLLLQRGNWIKKPNPNCQCSAHCCKEEIECKTNPQLSNFLLVAAKKKSIEKKTLINVLLVAAKKNLIKEQNPNRCSDCCSKEEPDQLVHHC